MLLAVLLAANWQLPLAGSSFPPPKADPTF